MLDGVWRGMDYRNAGITMGLGMMMDLEVMLASEERRALPLKPNYSMFQSVVEGML